MSITEPKLKNLNKIHCSTYSLIIILKQINLQKEAHTIVNNITKRHIFDNIYPSYKLIILKENVSNFLDFAKHVQLKTAKSPCTVMLMDYNQIEMQNLSSFDPIIFRLVLVQL